MQQLADKSLAPVFDRVPKVTIFFWLIKLMAVTVGETAADYLADGLGFGLSTTTWVMSAVLVVALLLQFAQRKYVPWAYWIAVVMISIVGTLITDNMVDNLGIALETSTIVFAVALVVTFVLWYAAEKTLSIHTIYTTRREIFYWLVILFTFALGTAAGDLVSESFDVGYLQTGIIFGAAIACVAVALFVFKIDGILAFWLAYILTRPFGASLGDLLSQPAEAGGLGLGTTVTSAIFLGTIAAIIVYMMASREGEETVAGVGGKA